MKAAKVKKSKKSYPFLGIRPSVEMEDRVRKLSEAMTAKLHRRVTMSEVVLTCLACKLPEMETKHKVAA